MIRRSVNLINFAAVKKNHFHISTQQLAFWKFWTKKTNAVEVGRDHLGNRYFEVQVCYCSLYFHCICYPSVSKELREGRRPRRYFLLPNMTHENIFEPGETVPDEAPPLWEAWLRHRRADPPSSEEQARRLTQTVYQAKQGHVLEERAGRERAQMLQRGEMLEEKLDKPEGAHAVTNFPRHSDEYEELPGGKVFERSKY